MVRGSSIQIVISHAGKRTQDLSLLESGIKIKKSPEPTLDFRLLLLGIFVNSFRIRRPKGKRSAYPSAAADWVSFLPGWTSKPWATAPTSVPAGSFWKSIAPRPFKAKTSNALYTL